MESGTVPKGCVCMLSPGHARLQDALNRWVRENTISPTDAEMLRVGQMTGEMLDRIDYRTNPTMKALGRGGGTFGGRGLSSYKKGKRKETGGNPFLSNQKGKFFCTSSSRCLLRAFECAGAEVRGSALRQARRRSDTGAFPKNPAGHDLQVALLL